MGVVDREADGEEELHPIRGSQAMRLTELC